MYDIDIDRDRYKITKSSLNARNAGIYGAIYRSLHRYSIEDVLYCTYTTYVRTAFRTSRRFFFRFGGGGAGEARGGRLGRWVRPWFTLSLPLPLSLSLSLCIYIP